ncbi:hypothetical protein CABS01_12717 [Colletotrichum abscissum]|uniref:Uncharacterized protein n=1 Tax=Colletotrichum abscissum TaxID=1671311 RepID=A0A9P9X366_9PEZI|nr:uncharacterized protein CABS01_12717 [Colletotrichum abscissum]KAI3533703.1 hypothetical protein CABS02_13457 [Colletotrichum abscissum]KAK1489566.1 hypothetical protein CABS01_12717 [Colletotrichum abscissum]
MDILCQDYQEPNFQDGIMGNLSHDWRAGAFRNTSFLEDGEMDGTDVKRSNHIPTFTRLRRFHPDSPGIPSPTRELLNYPQ